MTSARPKRGTAKSAPPEPLKPAASFNATDAATRAFVIHADNLRSGIPCDPLEVLYDFTQWVRRGHVPPDELLRWLAVRFGTYLNGGPKAPRLDECMGLAPPAGKRGREARTTANVTIKHDDYISRLAFLDHIGRTKKAAVLSLNDGDRSIGMEPVAERSKLADSSVRTLAPGWRKSDRYKFWRDTFRAWESPLSASEKLLSKVKGKK